MQVRSQLGGLRLPFIENQGQTDGRVAYYAPTFAGTLFVTRQGELVYVLPDAGGSASRGKGVTPAARPSWSLTETLLDGRPVPTAQERSVTGVSHFRGGDREQWRRDVPAFGQVGLGEVWPGVTSVTSTATTTPTSSGGRSRRGRWPSG